jgi:Peptidase propeptide and YPEB domain
MRIPRLAAIGAAAAAVLVASGTALAFTTADRPGPPAGIMTAADSTTFPTAAPSPPNAPQPPAPPAPSAPSAPAAPAPAAGDLSLSPDEAAGIALAHVGSGQVTQIEREVENGRQEWNVEINAGGSQHDVRVDAQSGAITRSDVDGSGNNGGNSNNRGDDNGGSNNNHGDDNGGGSHHGGDDHGGSDNGGSDNNRDNGGDDGGS